MPQDLYERRAPRLLAEQVKKNPPYPPYVDNCGAMPGLHLHVDAATPPLLMAVQETDWILDYNGARSVMSDAQFQVTYTKATGPY